MRARVQHVPPFALAFLFLIPCLFGFWVLDENRRSSDRKAQEAIRQAQTYDAWARFDSAYTACQRGNILRFVTNEQNIALSQIVVVLEAFFEGSVILRESAGKPVLAEDADRARKQIKEISDRLPRLPLVNCDVTIPKPQTKRPPPIVGLAATPEAPP
jgi:hypothetical protein